MNSPWPTPNATPLYDQDFYAWTQAQAQALADRRIADLDWDALKEEIEDLGKSLPREIKNRLRILLMHLLKWRFQPEQQKGGWEATILNQRAEILDLLEDNPSLQRYPAAVLADGKTYARARKSAIAETGLPASAFPAECPFTLENILQEDWLPSAADPNAADPNAAEEE